ncbi:alpha/beta hydrolase [Oerskovia sp. Sa1BUA8]|uniref:Alpha/beta hydrolase n=1 Tax=Oerskovia douganii TaxID=2762210 RepID=A0A9D5YY30_9CELL|nr:alpha/beta hydrolase [Oerskovia douganii]MBE7700163.1 alpha/beta hydrolase [Oerskovia douganii]
MSTSNVPTTPEPRRAGTPGRTSPAGLVGRLLLVLLGVALIAAPGWVVVTTGDTVRHQHWALTALLVVSATAGVLVLLATALSARRRTQHPAPERSRPRRVLRGTALGVGVAALVVLAAGVVWLRPFSATAPALAALESDGSVEVRDEAGWIAFVPQDGAATTGLVYSPGARVDVRATAAVLRPLAEAGYLVVALKEPLGIAFTSPNQSASAMAAFDEVDTWAVGGHSLGGVVAASFAAAHDDEVTGLLLHASYPSGDMSTADVEVTSVWGSRDGLTTPDKIEASRADLPATADFVEVPGGVHAFFADYGEQPGDGQPATSRADAQAQIIEASIGALDRLEAPSP